VTRLAGRVCKLLADGLNPQQIVKQLAPQTKDDALRFARHSVTRPAN